MLSFRRHQRGETIIEVLIALSILSLVLGLSYSAGSRSLRGSQDAQERTEASQVAQSNIEVIKAYATQGNAAIDTVIFPSTDTQICIDTSIQAVQAQTPPESGRSSAVCQQGERYNTFIDINPIVDGTTQSYEYTVHVEWDSIVSGSDNQAVMRYKWVRINP